MVGLNEECVIGQFFNNDYIIISRKKPYNKPEFLFINKIYRFNSDFGGIIKINKINLKEQTTSVNFKEIYVYFKNSKGDHTLRIQLKHFIEHFNFFFPNTKKHIILEKKL